MWLLFGVCAAAIVVFVFWFANRPTETRTVEWDPRIADLVAFVEQDRNLTFKHPVPVRYLPPDELAQEFVDAAAEHSHSADGGEDKIDETDGTDGTDEPVDYGDGFFRAQGLAEGRFDFGDVSSEYTEAAVSAFYDRAAQTIVVPLEDPAVAVLPAAVRPIVVHELVHALQAQRYPQFGLVPALDPSIELGLLEGDANTVEAHYIASMSLADWNDYWEASEASYNDFAEDVTAVPPIISAQFSQSYVLGQSLVEAVWADGGTDAVDALFTDPPIDTLAMLDPWGFIEGDNDRPDANEVVAPAGADVIGESWWGPDSITWLYSLSEFMPFEDALVAARSWETSEYLEYFDESDNSCFIAEVQSDGPLFAAVSGWVDRAADVRSVTGSGTSFAVHGCDPGVDADFAIPESFETQLYAVSFVAAGETWAVQNGLPRSVGTCLAFEQLPEGESPIPDDWFHFQTRSADDLASLECALAR